MNKLPLQCDLLQQFPTVIPDFLMFTLSGTQTE